MLAGAYGSADVTTSGVSNVRLAGAGEGVEQSR